MREDFWQFDPTHKVWLATNHKPAIRGTDHAIWRRIRLVPFTVTIPDDEQDKGLVEKLKAELPGILNWAIAGCKEWQNHGLGVPEAVKNATQAYRQEVDGLKDFLEECCVVGPRYSVSVGGLHATYVKWARENGSSPLTKIVLGQRLRERGFQDNRSNTVKFWTGIGLQP